MALFLCLKPDGTSVVSDSNPLSSKHSSAGEPKTIECYVANDGKRNGVPNDSIQNLIYTNLQVRIEGVSYLLGQAIGQISSDTTLTFDSVAGWNIGTIIRSGTERMRIEEVLTDRSIRVARNYTADGGSSVISSHSISAKFTAESTTVSLALPQPGDYSKEGVYNAGGEPLTGGFDPTNLVASIGNQESANIIRSSNASVYSVNSIIQIDEEKMKVTNISNNDITVIRGFDGTDRNSHGQNSVITCVGIVDIAPRTHKFFIKNDPPAGLPTQKKADIKIVLMADEEPL